MDILNNTIHEKNSTAPQLSSIKRLLTAENYLSLLYFQIIQRLYAYPVFGRLSRNATKFDMDAAMVICINEL